jgi:ATP-binding cassette subfamily E protein 1
MTRIAVVDNEKLKDMQVKKHIQSLCPVNRRGDECIYFEGNKLLIAEPLCIGCGICVKAAPDSIKIINLPEELKQEPIHRYGKNQFALYNLPTPMFGKVVGIIGKNGIGKSTAMQILARILKPNLGNLEKEATYKDLIERFKGSEAQNFFEKLEKKQITISYKPQQVDQIPKQTKGTVKQLLEKVDEKKELKKIVEILELKEVLNHDISKISGGELQRVAIAATVLKKANLYMFDEPTSFLDIKQRIKISKFIKELANEQTAVMVIEHDLIILDYMTDLIHLMYGSPGVYGVCSQTKSTKAGINIYLEGYMKEENVRFRDKKITFEKRAQSHETKEPILTEWQEFTHKLGTFELKANKGEIQKHDVTGILGENGIGKTSFVRVLSNDIKTSYSIKDLIISYKPQYIERKDELVMTYLQKALKYEQQLITPLELKSLLERNMKDLSGGELQKVEIAKCLSEEVDIYLLDEPSAYLDVEQRLVVSKIIRELMEARGKAALIVDHDLLFIDYLSKKLIVFEGRPAITGEVTGPFSMEEGMNHFLKGLQITFRRDEENNRPRVNKLDSVKDREQKGSGKLYYG